MNLDEFKNEIEKLNIKYTELMLEQLEDYCNTLLEYNAHTNLTAIREKNEVYLKHFYDSLTLVKVVDLEKINTVIDIGTGAGFPGLVLKIFFPHLKITLLDSNGKKTKFLSFIVDKLKLINIDIVNDRVEKYSKSHLNYFDLVTSRAVTNMPVLSELSLPLVKKDGLFVAMKGKCLDELEKADKTIKLMGGKIIDLNIFDLYNNSGERTLIKIKKIKTTDILEIRSYEKIIKKPR